MSIGGSYLHRRPDASQRVGRSSTLLLTLISCCVFTASVAQGQGLYIPSVGPVNQSMSGAAAACPIDSIGALNANPATISGLRQSEVAFGLGIVLPTTSLGSSVAANSLGAGLPPVDVAGFTDSEPGVCAVPTIGFIHRNDESPWTLGLGIFGVGGFSANYAASSTNPITMPQATATTLIGGLGRIHAKAEVYQVVPTVSYAVSDKLSFGISPMLTLANIAADPFFLAPPNDADGDGFFRYGSGNGTRMAWGGGFQVGTYYITDADIRIGVSYKSPQWLEPVRMNSEDELGNPTFFRYNLDLPSITTLGFAYSGFERWLLATDFRYFDYANADGFSQQGFNADGSVAGLGWKSILSVSQGVQYQVGPRLSLQTGYTFNQNPITQGQTFYNVASSLVIQHWYSLGATLRFNDRVSATVAYTHGFENSTTGPFHHPVFGPLAGTSVTTRVSADMLNAGITVAY